MLGRSLLGGQSAHIPIAPFARNVGGDGTGNCAEYAIVRALEFYCARGFLDRSLGIMSSGGYLLSTDLSGGTLPSQSVGQFFEAGFVTIPGPTSGDRLDELTTAYDEVMAVASGPDFKIGSTTTRMSDLLNYRSLFDRIYVYPPLLEACSRMIGNPSNSVRFWPELSGWSTLARTACRHSSGF